jgi:ABC-type multidrug transport system fused ATPase/permease subunit
MNRFNDWLAQKITNGVATMWCAYIFTGIAIYGYPYGSSDPRTIVQWFAQTFLQLVLLAILAVGQILLNKHVSKNHKSMMDLHRQNHDEIIELHKTHHAEILDKIKKVL